ncbi:MAG: ABC transporter permease [Pseudomonadota bacterium]
MLGERIKAYLYSSIVITAMWYIAFLAVKLPIVPSPFVIYMEIFGIFKESIAIHALYSIGRVFIGVFVSLFLGVLLGYLMGYFKRIDKLLSPLVYFTYPVPKMALLPIVMLLFGLGETSKVIMLTLIIIFQIIIAARDAVRAIPKEAYYSLYSLGATRFQIFKEIVAPASFSEIITSIRLALGTAVSILFFTEAYGTEYGMGYFIMDSWMRVNYIEMYAGIVVLSIIGVLIFVLIDIIESRICSWR